MIILKGETSSLSVEQLQELADAKMHQAEAIADEAAKISLERYAKNLRFTAQIKGWLNNELPPD